MISETDVLYDIVRRVRQRLGLAAAIRLVVRSSAGAAVLLLAWALATMIVPLPLPLTAVAAVAAGGALEALFGLTWALRPSTLAAARVADRRFGLADRLSTALELLAAPSRGVGRRARNQPGPSRAHGAGRSISPAPGHPRAGGPHRTAAKRHHASITRRSRGTPAQSIPVA